MITAKIIADSISPAGKRITTLQLCYPRFIHAEFMTHRVFSRNASSSRAIPVAKMLEQIRTQPAKPVHWGKNQPGMQAKEELTGLELKEVQDLWRYAAYMASETAQKMAEAGAHKQIVNRILEPFQHIHVVLTATEFENFFELRAHEDAQPEIHALAIEMEAAMTASTPILLQPGKWHLPYVAEEDVIAVRMLFEAQKSESKTRIWIKDTPSEMLCKISAARCCRVSYLKHDGTNSTIEEDLALCERLAGARPIHASPFEHQATPDTFAAQWANPHLHGNFVGWIQYRKQIEQQFR